MSSAADPSAWLACPFSPSSAVSTLPAPSPGGPAIHLCPYVGESQLPSLIALVAPQLSEPYSVFTYRFFLEGWPQLCFLAHAGERLVGAVVAKEEVVAGASGAADAGDAGDGDRKSVV